MVGRKMRGLFEFCRKVRQRSLKTVIRDRLRSKVRKLLKSEIHLLGTIAIKASDVEYGCRCKNLTDASDPGLLQCDLCKAADFRTNEFAFWLQRLGRTFQWHRKLWEYFYICQSLYERGMLRPGRTGLGFGVGKEPLVDLFAGFGCTITATDITSRDPRSTEWASSHQWSGGLHDLYHGLSPRDVFERSVSFREVDMNRIPEDLKGFDFLWSSCAVEHLGSLEDGKSFILQSMKCLKPGGIAVHTTEFNLDSDDITIESGSTVLFRKRDVVETLAALASEAHLPEPLSVEVGTDVLDQIVDYQPYYLQPVHLKLEVSGFAATSIGLIVKAGS